MELNYNSIPMETTISFMVIVLHICLDTCSKNTRLRDLLFAHSLSGMSCLINITHSCSLALTWKVALANHQMKRWNDYSITIHIISLSITVFWVFRHTSFHTYNLLSVYCYLHFKDEKTETQVKELSKVTEFVREPNPTCLTVELGHTCISPHLPPVLPLEQDV